MYAFIMWFAFFSDKDLALMASAVALGISVVTAAFANLAVKYLQRIEGIVSESRNVREEIRQDVKHLRETQRPPGTHRATDEPGAVSDLQTGDSAGPFNESAAPIDGER